MTVVPEFARPADLLAPTCEAPSVRPKPGRRPRVLLTSALGPYEPYYYDTSLTDVWNQRFSRGCDIFTVNGHIHTHFAHALAQNLDADTVFLEYPTRKNFLAELEHGYDYVGISGFQHQVDAIVRMARLVRERSPGSTIIIGGWAAMGLRRLSPQEWKAWATTCAPKRASPSCAASWARIQSAHLDHPPAQGLVHLLLARPAPARKHRRDRRQHGLHPRLRLSAGRPRSTIGAGSSCSARARWSASSTACGTSTRA